MFKSIRILLAIAAYYDYEIWIMDVKTMFLNGHLTEDVYMVQPKGFEDLKNPNKVCKLNKSMYGLKQASESWNLRFDQKTKEFGFVKNEDEPCVYKKESGSHVIFLILYVDDILLIGNHIPMLKDVKSWLGKCFAMKDLGDVAYILGIKIYRDRSKQLIGLSQSTYIDKFIRRFFMQDSKRGSLPMVHGTILNNKQCPQSDEDKKKMERVPYASAIGSIMYTMLCTRFDVSIKQSVVAQSTTESEYIAVSEVANEAAWMKKLIADLGVMPSIQKPIEILCDNTDAIAQAKEPRSHHSTKHILRRFHYI
ncbi:hypothetical protein L1987_57971 [Smallanthus sonchifolius]|uniref:Uncharacterized protein n=1 Tax=Smallanthus sonchifolius TaxID=185202 RepID=A0ACB9DEH5_9ASTR|nr:hypothetical protein L1987_57971 [Smallanthus sonchifolius]